VLGAVESVYPPVGCIGIAVTLRTSARRSSVALLQLEPDLRKAAQEIPGVPTLHEELAVGAHDDHPGEGHPQVGWRLAHHRPSVGAFSEAVDGDAIALVQNLVDRYVQVRKSRSKLLIKRL